jgi:hypothetical protein
MSYSFLQRQLEPASQAQAQNLKISLKRRQLFVVVYSYIVMTRDLVIIAPCHCTLPLQCQYQTFCPQLQTRLSPR